jgi:hypothetical protein
MTRPTTKTGARIGAAVLAAALFGILAMSVWYATRAWTWVDGPPMPAQGYVAMISGVIFSVALGCGLMALVFYSSRYGYDDGANRDQHLTDKDDRGLDHATSQSPGKRVTNFVPSLFDGGSTDGRAQGRTSSQQPNRSGAER